MAESGSVEPEVRELDDAPTDAGISAGARDDATAADANEARGEIETPSLAERRRRDRGWPNQRTLLLYLLSGVLIAAIPVVVSRLVDQPPGDTYTIDIPPGTAERLAAGEDVEVIPDELGFTLRDVLIIVNRDSAVHTIGPFEIGPGERSEHSFNEVAAISAYCSLHPSGSISISIGDG